MPVHIAFLGCGFITGVHSRHLKALRDDVVRSYASRDGSKAQACCRRYRGAGSYDSYTAAIEDPAVDAVVVVVPPRFHLDLTLQALSAGKHVLVEKPAYLRMEDYLRVQSAREGVRVPVAVDSPRRYPGAMNAIDERACGKPGCDNFGKPGLNIVGHGWFVTKSGRRRRYRCTVCGGTLSTHTGPAYRGLRCSRREFDQVASLRVEGVSISATARVTGHSRTTIARWLERASTAAACFNHRLLRDFDVIELQADALCTFIGSKRRTRWLFATIEVCSRLWAGSVLGRRSHRNTTAAINDVILRGRRVGCPLIATDGVEYYVGVMVRLLGSACVYGQVLKTRRNNRVVRVERRVKIGPASRLNAALLAAEDSETLNTSFIERLNLTIRQGSAYLRRRSPCHARGADQLRGHVELLRCYYNFIRPHRALRFGRETRTPALQAGLVSQRLALRNIFTAGGLTRRIFVAVVHVSVTVQPTESDEAELSTRCSPSARRQAA